MLLRQRFRGRDASEVRAPARAAHTAVRDSAPQARAVRAAADCPAEVCIRQEFSATRSAQVRRRAAMLPMAANVTIQRSGGSVR